MRRQFMRILKRISLLLLSLVMIISLSGCTADTNNKDERASFDRFIERQFIETMESDYTTAHVFLEHPENYDVDISKLTVNLGVRLDEESMRNQEKKDADSWAEFKKFERSKLTKEQQDTYDIYEFQNNLAREMSDNKFDYYQQLFESISGIHYQIPTMLADWSLRNEQDVKDIISLVNDVLPYLQGAIDYTKEQAKRDLLMIDVDAVREYCDNVIKSGENSLILSDINKNIDTLNLEESVGNAYKEQLKTAFNSSFIPAYQAVKDLMDEVSLTGNNEEGLVKFKNGKEYYELLLQNAVGSDKSVMEIKELMEDSLDKHISKLQENVIKNASVREFLTSGGEIPTTKYTSYDEILDDISAQLFEDFPSVSSLSYNIRDINEEIASSSGVAAYFNIPPLDGNGIKQLRVNPSTVEVSDLDTFSTVAHEGYPGHMYQYAYMYENIQSPYQKALANSSAYTEGYAVYAQFYAYKYLTGIDKNVLEALKENELASYDIMILCDIGIHYEGWSLDDFSDFISEKGINLEEDSLKTQYKQLQANPVAFEPYYVGYEEFMLLKETAQNKLGDKFNDKKFHEAILKSGNAPFTVVERNVAAYIKSAK